MNKSFEPHWGIDAVAYLRRLATERREINDLDRQVFEYAANLLDRVFAVPSQQPLPPKTNTTASTNDELRVATANLMLFLRRHCKVGADRDVWLKVADEETGAALAERIVAIERLLPDMPLIETQ